METIGFPVITGSNGRIGYKSEKGVNTYGKVMGRTIRKRDRS